MRLSVEPLCQTHNVQGRREPVYNSGNPHRKNKDGYFPAGKLLFHASFTLLKSFCQARSIECFPSSHVFSSKSKLLLSCTKSLQTFSAFFFYLMIHSKQSVSTNRRLVIVVVTISCICGLKRQVNHFTCRKDAR